MPEYYDITVKALPEDFGVEYIRCAVSLENNNNNPQLNYSIDKYLTFYTYLITIFIFH